MVQGDPRGFDRIDKVQHPVCCIQVGRAVSDLGTNVAVDTHHSQPRIAGRFFVGVDDFIVGDAEFITLQSG